MGFLQICAGVVLLQMSKSAKDVPDAAVFKGDLDQIREIGEQEQPESEPKADAIRGTAAILRRLSVSRQKKEEEEARRYREEKLKDQLEPLAENEIVEWDGLRRRKTVVGDGLSSPILRRKTIHPPLGMSRFPDVDEPPKNQAHADTHQHGFFETVRTRASSVLRNNHPRQTASDPVDANGHPHTNPVALADIKVYPKPDTPIEPYGPGSLEEAREHIYGLPPGLQRPDAHGRGGPNSPRSKPLPAQPAVQSPMGAPNIPLPSPLGKTNRRQFSFQNMFRGPRSPAPGEQPSASNLQPPPSRAGMGSRSGSAEQKRAMKTATEEERLGLVKGDSHATLLGSDLHSYPDDDSDPSSSPPRPLSRELQYPYAATTQDSAASSPEAHTPLVPKHSYLLSTSTMSDNAPLYQDLHTPGYFNSGYTSGYSAPPPPLHEEEAGVDDEWQIPPHHNHHHHEPQQQPTSHNPLPTITATSPPPHSHSQQQLPAYHNTNPYHHPHPHHQPPPQPHLEPPPAKAPTAASAPSPNTPTSQPLNRTATTTASANNDTTTTTSSSSLLNSGSPTRRPRQNRTTTTTREPPPPPSTATTARDLEVALAGMEVSTPEEREFKERWRRLAVQQQEQEKRRKERERDGGGARRGDGSSTRRDRGGGTGPGAGPGPAAAGAFI
jgi:magnesium transporter